MKNNEATIFIFIASIIFGLLIAMNIGFEGKNNFLDVKQYNEAYNDRNKLYSELNNLKEQYYNTNSKLKKYNRGNEKKYGVTDVIKKEISYNNMLLGKSDVEGPGVNIILDDNTDELDDSPIMNRLVHDSDIVKVINDLRNAGAEAISVNSQRIIYDNFGLCYGASIELNGVKIVAPFYISSIGNEDVLYNYLTLEQTHITNLKGRKVKVSVAKAHNIKILGYNGKIGYNYMRATNEKD